MTNKASPASAICPICGSSTCQYVKAYCGKSALFSKKKILECKCCGIAFVDVMPTLSDLCAYNESYFEKAHGIESIKKVQNSFFRGMAKLRLLHIQEKINSFQSSPLRVLEVGPGRGFLAEAFLAKWPKTDYFVVETDLSCHAFLNEKKVKILNSAANLPKVDMLILSHVLEHVPFPVQFMKRFVAALNSGGLLFIEVPCKDHLHKAVHEPHLLFFEKNSMQILLKKLRLRKIHLSYHGQSLENLMKKNKLVFYLRLSVSRIISSCWPKRFLRSVFQLQGLSTSEAAAVMPWQAHQESEHPAWWLRAVAFKP